MYSRRVGKRTLTFGVSGHLWRNAQVLFDEETRSLWLHLTGEAVAGPLKGERLMPRASLPRVRWDRWRSLYPQTVALSVDGREDVPFDRYAEYRRDHRAVGYYPAGRTDERAGAKEKVIGVAFGGEARAYRYRTLAGRRLVFDTVGGVPLLIYCDPTAQAVAVYRLRSGERVRLDGNALIGDGGKRWDALTGRALSPGAGARVRLPYRISYWFGWSAFHPRTSLYRDLPR